jgi:hypothetical protein
MMLELVLRRGIKYLGPEPESPRVNAFEVDLPQLVTINLPGFSQENVEARITEAFNTDKYPYKEANAYMRSQARRLGPGTNFTSYLVAVQYYFIKE